MPNYYLAVERSEHAEADWTMPPTYGFASCKDAEKLHPGDMMVDYVARGNSPREWGFAIVMEVEAWDTGLVYEYSSALGPTAHDYPWRVRVKVLCEIQDHCLMPKWRELRPYVDWCKDMSVAGANQTLRQPLRQISKHDFDLLAEAIRLDRRKVGVVPTPTCRGDGTHRPKAILCL